LAVIGITYVLDREMYGSVHFKGQPSYSFVNSEHLLGYLAHELKDEQGKIMGEFNKKQLKQYKEELHTQTEESEIYVRKQI
jgi:hypothetical protein